MAFNSYEFIFTFLPITLSIYYLLSHSPSKTWIQISLLLSSLFFYAFAGKTYLVFVFVSLFVNFGLSKLVQATSLRRFFLFFGLLLNIGSLIFYKCTDFFIINVNRLFSTEYTLLNLVAPLGISFFTFKQIAYIVNVYKYSQTYTFLDYANYILFFPEILSGPISLPEEIIPQLNSSKDYRFQPDNFSAGIYQFCFGLAKKVLLADVLSLFVDSCFVIREIPNSTMAFLGMFAYSLQIYFDFSGYSDMAVGIAKLFNIEIINNFNSPYKAITVGDFWKRWHISLTRFFTKYIYIPLGGNRKGLQRTCFNILIVFLVSGLWHGSNWTFIVWGVSHGLILVLERILNIHIPNQPITKALGRFATFMIVSVLWVFFRSDNISTAIKFIKEMCAFNFLPIEDSAAEVFLLPGIEFILTEFNLLSTAIYLPYIFLGLCFILTQFGDNIEQRTKSLNYRKTSNAIIAAILAILSIISFSSVSKFIYWNF